MKRITVEQALEIIKDEAKKHNYSLEEALKVMSSTTGTIINERLIDWIYADDYYMQDIYKTPEERIRYEFSYAKIVQGEEHEDYFEEDEGPFGGAFRSWDDYYSYRGI